MLRTSSPTSLRPTPREISLGEGGDLADRLLEVVGQRVGEGLQFTLRCSSISRAWTQTCIDAVDWSGGSTRR